MHSVGEPLSPYQWELPELARNEVVVEIHGCGLCHTDLGYLYDGVPIRSELPLVLGHEIVGVVVETGEDSSGWQGKAVIIPAVIPCGDCSPCSRGKPGICSKQIFPGNDIHGGFASHIVVPSRGLCEVPPSSDSNLALYSVIADAVTTPLNAVERSGLSEGDVAVFVGVGGLGIFGAQIARAYGANVIVLDVDDEKLEKARAIGFEHALNVQGVEARALKKQLRSLATENRWPKAEWKIFETSGTAPGQEIAYALLNFGAALMVVGYTTDEIKIRLSNLMAFEARAEGVWGCPPSRYPKALELVQSGKVQLEPFVEVRPMNEINEILTAAHAGNLKKRVVMTPNS